MAIGAAIHYLSCLPQFCLHADSGTVVDMRCGAIVSCLDNGDGEEHTHLFIRWPGLQQREGTRVGAVKYLELQTSEAAILGDQAEALDEALQAVLLAIGARQRPV